jgi:hypothetical protein
MPFVRRKVVLLLLLMAWAPAAHAQDWVRKMFPETSHDFGTVARGSNAVYRFKFNNPFVESAHIMDVRSSCGCTSVEATKKDLKTWEVGEVVAKLNTNSFLGVHAATITVEFDKPYYAQIQLQVTGNILSDVVLQPGQVELGTIDAGQGAERKIMLTRVNASSNWTISDVQSANTNFEVEVNEAKRIPGTVVYELVVRLKPTSPPGYIDDQLFLVTNDPESPKIPVDVVGRVVAAVTVSPPALILGAMSPGQSVTKNVVVRSKKPFKVLGVACDSDITYKLPDDARETQIIQLTFTAPQQPGAIKQQIKIKTDLGDNVVPEITCQATVTGAATPPAEISAGSTESAQRETGAASTTGFRNN